MSGGDHKKKQKKKKQVVEEEEEFVVEAIIDKRREGHELLYLVKWKDWPHTSNTWEPISNLTGCSEMLEAFEAKLTSKGPESTAVKDRKRSTFENDSEGGDSSSVYDSDVDIGKNESKSNSIDVDVLEECPVDREADELLGVVPINGIMTYLVKWKAENAGIVTDGDDQDMNLVRADVFKYKFPSIVISFYEKHIIWSHDDRTKTDALKDASFEVNRANARKIQIASVVPSMNSKQRRHNPLDMSSSESESERGSDDTMEVDPTVM